MATKKPKLPKGYKKARKDAKGEAKKAFPGKTKAVQKDPKLKISAQDEKDIATMKKEAKAGVITDEKGKAYRIKDARTFDELEAERARARRAFFSQDPEKAAKAEARMEASRKKTVDKIAADKAAAAKSGRGGSALVQTAAKDRSPVKLQGTSQKAANAGVKKPAAKPKAKSKFPTVGELKKKREAVQAVERAEAAKKPQGLSQPKSAYSFMKNTPAVEYTPAQRKLAEEYTRELSRVVSKQVKESRAKVAQTPKAAPKPKAAAPKPKTTKFAQGELKTPAEVARYKAAKAAGKSPAEAYAAAKKGTGKALVPTNARTQAAKGAAKAAGKIGPKGAIVAAGRVAGKGAGKILGGRVGAAVTLGTLAAGPIIDAIKGKGKSGAAPSSAKSKANDRLYPQGTKPLATKTGEERRPRLTQSGASVKPAASAITGNVYRVEHNDTLESIAKRAGVSLAELKRVNPKAFSQKYIFRNTKINIPQGKAVPSGSYTGPVPYIPGSKAAKKYEATLPPSKRNK